MSTSKVLVWDLPTRVFHWLFALSFAGAFLTAESERLREIHVMLGYTMLGLLAFRLLWAILGTRYARFISFAFGPRRVLSYLKSLPTRSPQHYLRHKPAGSWAIYALVVVALLTGLTGYATFNDIGGDWLGDLHEGLANTFLAIVGVHIAGVLVSSLVHRENLVRSMLSGWKRGNPREGIRYRHRAIGVALALAVAAFWIAPDSLAPFGMTQARSTGQHVAHEHHDRD
jgi:cytochrome b